MKITNYEDGEEICYNVVVLNGESTGKYVLFSLDFPERKWPIVNGNFKVIFKLSVGLNTIHLQNNDKTEELTLSLVFRQRNLTRIVRPLYIVSADCNGQFQGPDETDCSLESAKRRISTASLLLQSFTAEKLYEHGFVDRRTFDLELDKNGNAICDVFRSNHLTLSVACKLSQREVWSVLFKELKADKKFSKTNIKYLAFLSFTRYQPVEYESDIPQSHSEIVNRTWAHIALGGDNLALFGSATLHTWAESISDVYDRFTDQRIIDRMCLMDDSAGRKYYWANFSTGLGSALHELGHTFGLVHTPTGVMARGFDDLYIYFTVPTSSESRRHSISPVFRRRHQRKNSTSNFEKSRNGSSNDYRSRSYSASSANRSPLMQIEKSFTQNSVDERIETIRKDDGSVIKKTVKRSCDGGSEIVSEVKSFPKGDFCEKRANEILKDLITGKVKSTMSMSIYCLLPPKANKGNSTNGLLQTESTDEMANLNFKFQDLKYKDGGAHWYRSSAILLYNHKWFREDCEETIPEYREEGNFYSSAGIQLLEVRSFPENIVLHHWEFLCNVTPTSFTVHGADLRLIIGNECEQLTFMAVDSNGGILRVRLNLNVLIRFQSERGIESASCGPSN